MRTKTLLFTLLLFSAMVSAQMKRVAILETVDRENKVSYANKLILRANLSKAITLTSGYEAYDRTDVDAIMSEQNFQRTGMVSNDQIKRLGEMTGANYILVAEAVVVDTKNMFITAKLLDVETARTIMTDNVMMGTTPDAIQDGCAELAKRLFHVEDATEITQKLRPTKTSLFIPEVADRTYDLVRHSKADQRMLGVKKYSYGDLQMDEQAFQRFLYKNNSRAYVDYTKSRKLIPAGWLLLGGGIVLAFPLGFGLGTENETTLYDYGIPCWTIGGAVILSSIPILCVGYSKKNRALSSINNSLDKSEFALSLNLQASQNGIGLALNF